MRARAGIRRLAGDQRGAALIEFAIAAPVICMTVLGLFDLGYNIYAKAMLEGAIQKAARDSALEGAAPGTIDTRVETAVHRIVPSALVDITRRSYTDFTNAAQSEEFDDIDSNGVCNGGEPYDDSNNNNAWDADRGQADQGGARDAVMYQVNVSYDRAFPLAGLIGLDPQATVRAVMVLRNQPYGMQNTIASGGVRNCT